MTDTHTVSPGVQSGTISEYSLAALPDIAASATPPPVSVAAQPLPKPHLVMPPAEQPTMPNLLGSSETDVIARLGLPQVRDVRRPAHLWRYVKADCALDLLFFYDVANDRYRLAMVMRDNGAVVSAETIACLLPGAKAGALS